MSAQEVQISLSLTATHIHSVTSLLFVCLYCIQASAGYIHHVRQEGKKALYLLASFTHIHTNTRADTHTYTHKEESVVKGRYSGYQC